MIKSYKTVSPVLLIIFNRPDLTEKVFEQIRQVAPPRLYLAGDGPRPERPDDIALCDQSRAIIDRVDWHCEVKTLYRVENLGCKYAVSSAVDWFFKNEEEGIILEDDCLPNSDFFLFCDLMLDRYRQDTRIRHITGCNLQGGQKWGHNAYYFSNNSHVWGWASWRRVWDDYDVELSRYQNDEVEEQVSKIFEEEFVVKAWKGIFEQLKLGNINTWDYQLGITNYFHNGLCIIPNYNLISNIGFRADGTHVFDSTHKLANIPLERLPDEISHPKYILPEKKADLRTLYDDFDVVAKIKERNKFKNKVKRFFKKR